MFDLFRELSKHLKLDAVCIDNNVFRLHYKATFVILMGFSLLVTAKQYIGDPIDCIIDEADEIPQKIMDTYCWIYSTFTLPYRTGTVGKDVIAQGVAAFDGREDVKYHKYYQWVCFTLFFQSLLFYAPRYLWKSWEGGRMKMLVSDLNVPIIEDNNKNRKELLVQYFIQNLNAHNYYAFRFFFCEVLNFLNVLVQIYFMDYFLDGEFTTYGPNVIKFTQMEPEDRFDPMSKVFPKLTKCTFNNYGSSGTIQKVDGLCVLPLNVLNEKIYVFLWFWFIGLTILTGLSLLYRLAIIWAPQLRLILLCARSRLSPFQEVKCIADKCQIGDWFILYQLGKNVDPVIYRQFITDVVMKFEGKGNI